MRSSPGGTHGLAGWSRAGLAAMLLQALAGESAAYDGQFIQFTIAPTPAVRGLSLTVSGWAAPSAAANEVHVMLVPPATALTQVGTDGSVTRADDGRFSWTSGPLAVAGNWIARVEAPGLDEVAEESFEVVETAAAFGLAAQALADAGRTQMEAIRLFHTATADYPATPGQGEALQQAAAALQALDSAQERITQFQIAMEALTSAAEGVPAPEVQEALAQGALLLATHSDAVRQAQAVVVDRVADTKSTAFWCQHWFYQCEVVKETLNLYLKVVTLVEGVTVWCLNTMKNALTEGVQKLIDSYLFDQYTPEQQAMIQECKRNGLLAVREIENACGGFQDIQGPLTTAIEKCTEWVVDDALSNCERYIGPLDGDLRIDYYLAGAPYMRTRYKVTGKAELFFEKRRGPADVVSLKGKLRGDCRMFIGSMDLRHVVQGLPGTDYIAFNIPRYIPRNYLIGVEGEALHDKLRLQLLRPAFTDFERAMYRFCIILFSAFQLVPLPDIVDVPVPGAEWFFTRVTGTAGDDSAFEIPLSVEGAKSVASRDFQREMDYLETDDFKAFLNLDFKACSSGCD
ncbi:hypothetical protein JXA88_10860 [Candidatus Fermentibacteria bacterium]|nr:hypothetical protein [Candidatus Fermentibacteria bacterium]